MALIIVKALTNACFQVPQPGGPGAPGPDGPPGSPGPDDFPEWIGVAFDSVAQRPPILPASVLVPFDDTFWPVLSVVQPGTPGQPTAVIGPGLPLTFEVATAGSYVLSVNLRVAPDVPVSDPNLTVVAQLNGSTNFPFTVASVPQFGGLGLKGFTSLALIPGDSVSLFVESDVEIVAELNVGPHTATLKEVVA